LFTPRHKRTAQAAIDSLNKAIAGRGQAIATINDATATGEVKNCAGASADGYADHRCLAGGSLAE